MATKDVGAFLCLGFLLLFMFYLAGGLPYWIAERAGYTMDAKVKTTEEWEEENMTNKERVARWREEQKKKSD